MPTETELRAVFDTTLTAARKAMDAKEGPAADRLLDQADHLRAQIKTAQRDRAVTSIGADYFAAAENDGPLMKALRAASFDPGTTTTKVSMGSALRLKASDFPGDTTEELPNVRGPFVGLSRDTRFVYTSLPASGLGEDLAISEYVETTAPTVSGNVERDPLATTDKATLEVHFDFAAEKAKQLAITVDDVPNAILNSFAAFSGLINARMQRELDEAADLHVLDQINAASPDGGGTGTDTIADLRNGVAAMRAVGANPTIAAINPDDAADLDLTQVGADDLYLFSLRSTGNSSPLFGLRFVEAKNVPQGSIYLIDTAVLGVFYVGPSTFLSDPYTGMKKNLTSLRLEQTALFHVRNIQGAYVVGSS
jgi:capsid protein